MATSETVNIQQADVVVNRWLVDYYLVLAIDLLEREQYNDFCAIRNVLDYILSRPLESAKSTPKNVRVLNFLTWINKGEQLDVASDTDPTLSPLESALEVLESMKEDCHQLDYDKVSSSLKEMIVKMFIVNGKIGQAKKALKHFPKSMFSKKAALMGLIDQKSSGHNISGQVNFGHFREEMLAFCQELCQFTPPFLFKAAVRLIKSRHTEPGEEAPEQQEEPEQLCCERVLLRQCNRVFMEKSRLEAGFNVLADGTSFNNLQEEEERAQSQPISLHLSPSPEDANGEVKDQLYQRTSDSPMEASPADEPAQMCDVPQPPTSSLSKMGTIPTKRRQCTIAQLVVEPDSPVLSQEVHCELATKETQESPEQSNADDSLSPIIECEVSKPVRKHSFKSCDRAKARSEGKMPPKRNEDISDPDEILRETENGDVEVSDGLDSSHGGSILAAVPPTSSTPDKNKSTPNKWKKAFNSARESKEAWSDEEALFDDGSSNESLSNSGQRKRKWTDSETRRLKEGVEKFGEGNWCKIKAYYNFKDRTNVNLKDRWRTMKKLKMV